MRKLLLGAAFGAGVLALAAMSYADDCVCTECAGDPVFIQRDLREPEQMAHTLRLMKEQVPFDPRTEAIVLKGDESTVRVER